jgi:hypothetical protein
LVPPEGGQQSELSLKKIQDVLNDPAALKDLEQRDGVSRSDLQQYAKQFEKKASAPAGPGREITVKPGEQTAAKPTPNLPGLAPTKFSTKTKTDRGSMPQDQVSNNLEDLRFRPPAELRGKYVDYKNSLAVPPAKRPATPSPKDGK